MNQEQERYLAEIDRKLKYGPEKLSKAEKDFMAAVVRAGMNQMAEGFANVGPLQKGERVIMRNGFTIKLSAELDAQLR